MNSNLKRALDSIDVATAGITDDQLRWQPEGKWSTAEILEHLSLAFSGTVKGFNRVLEARAPQSRRPTLYERLSQILVLDIGYFPPGRKAPQMVVPHGIAPQEAMDSIRQNLASMDKIIRDCESCFGQKVKVLTHPILGPLSISQWRKFHFVHTRHHMRQIEALRAKMAAKGVPPSV